MMRSREPFDVYDALQMLYSKSEFDLTSGAYNEAMRRLRRKDPATARRVERMLKPSLKKRFLRRQREWYETSEGTRARLALLPGNPHVQVDTYSIREVLQIPPGHIHITEEDMLWRQVKGLVRPEGVRRVVEGNLVALWLYIHREAALSRTVETEDNEMLSYEMRQSAVTSAGVDLQTSQVPEWLHPPPLLIRKCMRV